MSRSQAGLAANQTISKYSAIHSVQVLWQHCPKQNAEIRTDCEDGVHEQSRKVTVAIDLIFTPSARVHAFWTGRSTQGLKYSTLVKD